MAKRRSAVVFGACLVGLGASPYIGNAAFLGFLLCAGMIATVWAMRAQKRTVVAVSAAVVMVLGAALHFISGQLGVFTWFLTSPGTWIYFIAWLTLYLGGIRFLLPPKVAWGVAIVSILCLLAAAFRLVQLSSGPGYVVADLIAPTARLYLDGKPINGHVYASITPKERDITIVRRSSGDPGIYSLYVSEERNEVEAGRCWPLESLVLPALVYTDIYNPCFDPEAYQTPPPSSPERNLKVGANWAEFTTDDRKRLRVEW